jgi:hypothetical protein
MTCPACKCSPQRLDSFRRLVSERSKWGHDERLYAHIRHPSALPTDHIRQPSWELYERLPVVGGHIHGLVAPLEPTQCPTQRSSQRPPPRAPPPPPLPPLPQQYRAHPLASPQSFVRPYASLQISGIPGIRPILGNQSDALDSVTHIRHPSGLTLSTTLDSADSPQSRAQYGAQYGAHPLASPQSPARPDMPATARTLSWAVPPTSPAPTPGDRAGDRAGDHAGDRAGDDGVGRVVHGDASATPEGAQDGARWMGLTDYTAAYGDEAHLPITPRTRSGRRPLSRAQARAQDGAQDGARATMPTDDEESEEEAPRTAPPGATSTTDDSSEKVAPPPPALPSTAPRSETPATHSTARTAFPHSTIAQSTARSTLADAFPHSTIAFPHSTARSTLAGDAFAAGGGHGSNGSAVVDGDGSAGGGALSAVVGDGHGGNGSAVVDGDGSAGGGALSAGPPITAPEIVPNTASTSPGHAFAQLRHARICSMGDAGGGG